VAPLSSGIDTCVAFAAASLAVHDVLALIGARMERPLDDAVDLLVELVSAHDRLRDLFDNGHDLEVCGLALSIQVLAERTVIALK